MKNQTSIPFRAKLALWLARKICPDAQQAFLPTPEKIKTIQKLNGEIGRLNSENKKWRDRCFSTERLVSYVIPEAMKGAVYEHDEKYGTDLRYHW